MRKKECTIIPRNMECGFLFAVWPIISEISSFSLSFSLGKRERQSMFREPEKEERKKIHTHF